jgi:hypothetical protein
MVLTPKTGYALMGELGDTASIGRATWQNNGLEKLGKLRLGNR